MTVRAPLFIGSASHPEQDVRLGMGAMFGLPSTTPTRPGGVVVGYGGMLAVTQAASPAMSVLVASGAVQLAGTVSPTQGNYMLVNDATVTLAVQASHGSLPRVDIVVARAKDDDYGDPLINIGGYLEVVTGTANAVRTVPATPANAVKICELDIAATSTTVLNSNVTDLRTWTVGVGGVLPCKSTLRPLNPFEGMKIHETDTGYEYVFASGVWTHPAYASTRIVGDNNYSTFTSASTTYTSLSGGGTPVSIGVAYMAPRSGLVVVMWKVRMVNSIASSCLMAPETRIGSTIGAGTVHEAAGDNHCSGYTGDTGRAERPVGLHYITGLTPGSWYNTRILHRVTAGTGTFDDREVVVIPSL
jgi:hypothetical protein